MEIIKGPKAFKLLSKVVARVDLTSIFLLKSSFWRSVDALDYERVGLEISTSGKLFEVRDDCFFAKATFSLLGAPVVEGEAKERNEVASIKAEYVLMYALTDKIKLSKEELKIFCDINSVYNAWPYWREFVQSSVDRMGLPTITMPLLKFRPAKRASHEEKEEEAKE
jgi:hypothetical protein